MTSRVPLRVILFYVIALTVLNPRQGSVSAFQCSPSLLRVSSQAQQQSTTTKRSPSITKTRTHQTPDECVVVVAASSNNEGGITTTTQSNNYNDDDGISLFEFSNPNDLKAVLNYITLIRVGIPALLVGAVIGFSYEPTSLYVAELIQDAKAFDVIANDYSQYIQNILTTSGLMFSIITGYTYYFLYQQQEAIYLAFFEEITMAKSLLEQVSLVSQGRPDMYKSMIGCMDRYVKEDLTRFNVEPSTLLARRPMDDPLEELLFLTSVGEPSIIYSTVKSLRQARAYRLGALQRKLPQLHNILLVSLAIVVLFTFPVLGAGSQTIGGENILKVQSVYISFIGFGIALVLGVLQELQNPAGTGAYSIATVLSTIVRGMKEELEGRIEGKYEPSIKAAPSADVAPAKTTTTTRANRENATVASNAFSTLPEPTTTASSSRDNEEIITPTESQSEPRRRRFFLFGRKQEKNKK